MTPQQPVLLNDVKSHEFERVFAKDQPQYQPLPALVLGDGTVISRWRLTWRERLLVLLCGDIYLQQLTFNEPLQPQLPSVDEPTLKYEEA